MRALPGVAPVSLLAWPMMGLRGWGGGREQRHPSSVVPLQGPLPTLPSQGCEASLLARGLSPMLHRPSKALAP